MTNMMKKGLLLFSIALLMLLGCRTQFTTTTRTYALPELKYRLFSQFDVFWCNPYFWPIVREEQEKIDAVAQYPAIRANTDEFTAILEYLSLSNKEEYANEEKLLIFRQHEKLTLAVQMIASGDTYSFTLREGEGQGWRYEGTITTKGKVTILKKESSFNTYPICLAKGTLIDTPDGQIPVELLGRGMKVWSIDETGKRIVISIVQTSRTYVPMLFEVVMIVLEDGRTVSASPNHPSAVGRALGEYKAGDLLDGSKVLEVEPIPYEETYTYDLLPDGDTGFYWANGVLLGSTLVKSYNHET